MAKYTTEFSEMKSVLHSKVNLILVISIDLICQIYVVLTINPKGTYILRCLVFYERKKQTPCQ